MIIAPDAVPDCERVQDARTLSEFRSLTFRTESLSSACTQLHGAFRQGRLGDAMLVAADLVSALHLDRVLQYLFLFYVNSISHANPHLLAELLRVSRQLQSLRTQHTSPLALRDCAQVRRAIALLVVFFTLSPKFQQPTQQGGGAALSPDDLSFDLAHLSRQLRAPSALFAEQFLAYFELQHNSFARLFEIFLNELLFELQVPADADTPARVQRWVQRILLFHERVVQKQPLDQRKSCLSDVAPFRALGRWLSEVSGESFPVAQWRRAHPMWLLWGVLFRTQAARAPHPARARALAAALGYYVHLAGKAAPPPGCYGRWMRGLFALFVPTPGEQPQLDAPVLAPHSQAFAQHCVEHVDLVYRNLAADWARIKAARGVPLVLGASVAPAP